MVVYAMVEAAVLGIRHTQIQVITDPSGLLKQNTISHYRENGFNP